MRPTLLASRPSRAEGSVPRAGRFPAAAAQPVAARLTGAVPAAARLGSALLAGSLLVACGHGATTASPSSPSLAQPQSSHTASPSSACSNVDVPAAVKAALVQADGRANATEVPGATFYGTCGTTQYAVTRMTLGPAGTSLQRAAFTGTGAYPELLVDTGMSWAVVSRSTTPTGCTSGALPTELLVLWQNCAVAASVSSGSVSASTSPTPTQTATGEAACEQHYAGKVFVLAKSATVRSDGSAVLTGAPVTVHCGGPDDFQFLPQAGTLSVDLAAGATITVVDEPNTVSAPLAVSKLPAYVTSGKAESDVFLLTGAQHGAVFDATAIAEQFHP